MPSMSSRPRGYGAFVRQSSTARQVAKLLRDAKVADILVEQPTEFVLAVNPRTAKTLGVAIPPTLLSRADQVIECWELVQSGGLRCGRTCLESGADRKSSAGLRSALSAQSGHQPPYSESRLI